MCSIKACVAVNRVVAQLQRSLPEFKELRMPSLPVTKPAFNFINVTNGAASHAPEQAVYAKISQKTPTWGLYLSSSERSHYKVVIRSNSHICLKRVNPYFVYPS